MIAIALRDAIAYLSERLMGCYRDMAASLRLELAHFSKEFLAGIATFLKPSTSEIFKKRYRISLFLVLFGVGQLASLSAHGATTNWANCTAVGT